MSALVASASYGDKFAIGERIDRVGRVGRDAYERVWAELVAAVSDADAQQAFAYEKIFLHRGMCVCLHPFAGLKSRHCYLRDCARSVG